MPSLFSGKIVLITGSTRGIGWATAQLMAQHGATVILNGRDPVILAKKVAEIRERFGTPCTALAFDASQPTAIREAYKSIFTTYKRLDTLVNNAGVMRNSVLGMITDEAIRETFDINTIAVIHHVQEASRLMTRNKSGSIVNLMSVVGRTGAEGQIVYAASKSALVGITLSAAKELAGKGIRVNAVAPGMIRTDLIATLPKEKLQERLGSIRMGRFGEPEEVAQAILFLASDAAAYITGQILAVDGGIVL
jgi:3-oxoacyl-[acyl-carrier protein] reductase